MKLQDYLETTIGRESDKLIQRYHAYHNSVHIGYLRNLKRLSNAPPKDIKQPDYWGKDRKFNPFYVKSHRKSIAHSIARKLRSNTYKPNDPYVKQIPKHGGGIRNVAIYQIPDAVVSRIFYERLLAKNKHRFSSFAYAYRNDRNVHFAIQDISLDISNYARIFIAEFDFSDFFGSISHEYLRSQFDCNGFYVSNEERAVINSFLDTRDVGIPQGTSISLFLANLACWRLDRALEGAGLKFARYADDTVIWSESYQKICDAYTIINDFSSKTGISINAEKSDGISLLSKKGLPTELANTKSSIAFLGYAISVDAISIKEDAVKKIKQQISYLLYRNLIQPLRGAKLQGLVMPSNGKDPALLTAMMQIRRYLYGGLTSQQLRDYINGRSNRLAFKGIMSFYPLVNDQRQLRALDGWLVSTVYRAVQYRSKLLIKWKHNQSHQFPFNVARSDLVTEFGATKVGRYHPFEVASFMLVQRAFEQGLKGRGIEGVMNPDASEYNY